MRSRSDAGASIPTRLSVVVRSQPYRHRLCEVHPNEPHGERGGTTPPNFWILVPKPPSALSGRRRSRNRSRWAWYAGLDARRKI